MDKSKDTQLEDLLIERYQRGLPLVPRPFAAMAQNLGVSERSVLVKLGKMLRQGKISRIGPVVRPGLVGISTLAAIAVPRDRIEEVAECISSEPGVNHNYEREGEINLWFVLHAPDDRSLCDQIKRISSMTVLPVYDLRLEREYRIDLGFSLSGQGPRAVPSEVKNLPISAGDIAVINALEDGLQVEPEPFDRIARRSQLDIDSCLSRIKRLVEAGIIRRFGLVLHHRAFGYDANAMVVWNVPDDQVDRLGKTLAECDGVNLCYRRRRAMPAWPFNLYAMIHGKDRAAVLARIESIVGEIGLEPYRRSVLFSNRCFKQVGPRRKAA